jgi:membrane protease YdiL (CAAX protease family)
VSTASELRDNDVRETSTSEAGIAEALVVFALIMAYIWKLRSTHPLLWLLPVGAIFASHVARRERAPGMGFRTGNFVACARKFGPVLIGLVVVMWSAGWLAGSIRPLGFWEAAASFGIYVPWGLFQQYLMNGYFLKRFEMALSGRVAAVVTAGLFGLVHAPNWFLMLVTPVTGFVAIQIYRKYGNLYFLGLAHAAIGFALFMVVPDSVTHHLRVGPGWYTYR